MKKKQIYLLLRNSRAFLFLHILEKKVKVN
jgi:hypothetical protein